MSNCQCVNYFKIQVSKMVHDCIASAQKEDELGKMKYEKL